MVLCRLLLGLLGKSGGMLLGLLGKSGIMLLGLLGKSGGMLLGLLGGQLCQLCQRRIVLLGHVGEDGFESRYGWHVRKKFDLLRDASKLLAQ